MPANARKRGSQSPTEREERRKKVAANILSGLTFRQIAEAMGISLGTVSGDWKVILRRYREEQVHAADEYIKLEQQRLDSALNAIWQHVVDGDAKHIELYLKISERRSRLMGLDAPQKVAPTDPTGHPSHGVMVVSGMLTPEQWQEQVQQHYGQRRLADDMSHGETSEHS